MVSLAVKAVECYASPLDLLELWSAKPPPKTNLFDKILMTIYPQYAIARTYARDWTYDFRLSCLRLYQVSCKNLRYYKENPISHQKWILTNHSIFLNLRLRFQKSPSLSLLNVEFFAESHSIKQSFHLKL